MNQSLTACKEEDLRQLQALVADREARMANIVGTVARVRHGINNPLAALLGQAQLLLREELPGKSRARVEKIERMAIRISEALTELRDL